MTEPATASGAATTDEAATTGQAAATTEPPKRSTRLATTAQIAGIIGIVVCIAIIVGTWLGHGALSSAVDDLAAGVNAGFVRAISVTGQVSDRLDAAASQAGDLATQANQVAGGGVGPDVAAGLGGSVAQLADTYRQLRARADDLRENVSTAVASVQRIARFAPGVEAPSGPPPKVQALSDKLQAIDDRVSALTTALGGAAPSGDRAK